MNFNEKLAAFLLDTFPVHWISQIMLLMAINLGFVIFWRIFMDIFDYFKFYRWDHK